MNEHFCQTELKVVASISVSGDLSLPDDPTFLDKLYDTRRDRPSCDESCKENPEEALRVFHRGGFGTRSMDNTTSNSAEMGQKKTT